MKTLKDFDVKNKRVLVRCDFNVPLDAEGKISDDFKIKQTLPTISHILNQGAKIILMSHRSDDKSLNVVRKRLEKYLKGEEFILLKSLRSNKGEIENNDQFAKELANLADIYINDAFGVCHRKHASVVGVPKYLPSGAGFLLEKEIEALSKVLKNPERPLAAIVGGVKVESKAGVIDKFLQIADYLLVGEKIAEKIESKSNKFYRPVDSNNGLDIGDETIKMFSKIIKKANTILWAGPLGKFEDPLYEKGTKEIAKEITKNNQAFKVAGGGDTIFALTKFGLRDKFDHISTGGGAMLQFLSGEELPGLEALNYYA